MGSASPGRPLYLQTEGGYQRTEKEPFIQEIQSSLLFKAALEGKWHQDWNMGLEMQYTVLKIIKTIINNFQFCPK